MKHLLIGLSIIVAVSFLTSFIRPKHSVDQQPQKLKFEFTENEVNVILRGASKLPYEESAPVIQSIYSQVQKQLADTSKTKKP